jgi:hypothetical protein
MIERMLAADFDGKADIHYPQQALASVCKVLLSPTLPDRLLSARSKHVPQRPQTTGTACHSWSLSKVLRCVGSDRASSNFCLEGGPC